MKCCVFTQHFKLRVTVSNFGGIVLLEKISEPVLVIHIKLESDETRLADKVLAGGVYYGSPQNLLRRLLRRLLRYITDITEFLLRILRTFLT